MVSRDTMRDIALFRPSVTLAPGRRERPLAEWSIIEQSQGLEQKGEGTAKVAFPCGLSYCTVL